ncbi:GNAT family N-acetyltransferase [Neobacillus niacini]|uniref:GNAT family N-acetyltransferase n=1 Tax=Neobacillus niacini TaxID=86668 RepID=UPI0021CB0C06|nr:GNAT family N-acetyltransferase [Neobacillus niacini]MCM3766878.1 GNAT family N-acetyltransferase [Neobacillus niacini]
MMEVVIRKAEDTDRETFLYFVQGLSKFNRSNHPEEVTYDDYETVLNAITKKAAETFDERDHRVHILLAFLNGQAVGYALGRVFDQDGTADNGTGKMGLFDELFVLNEARGHGIGKKLIDSLIDWFKNEEIHRIKLHAYSWNNNAKKLYERLGFKEYAVS